MEALPARRATRHTAHLAARLCAGRTARLTTCLRARLRARLCTRLCTHLAISLTDRPGYRTSIRHGCGFWRERVIRQESGFRRGLGEGAPVADVQSRDAHAVLGAEGAARGEALGGDVDARDGAAQAHRIGDGAQLGPGCAAQVEHVLTGLRVERDHGGARGGIDPVDLARSVRVGAGDLDVAPQSEVTR